MRVVHSFVHDDILCVVNCFDGDMSGGNSWTRDPDMHVI